MTSILSVTEGQVLQGLSVRADPVSMFRFSAATWNAHLVHFDLAYARTEGYQAPIVQSHLHGAYLARCATEWLDEVVRLVRFSWQNRHVTFAGDELICSGRVTSVRSDGRRWELDLDLEERNQDGVLCAPAEATVVYVASTAPSLDGRS